MFGLETLDSTMLVMKRGSAVGAPEERAATTENGRNRQAVA